MLQYQPCRLTVFLNCSTIDTLTVICSCPSTLHEKQEKGRVAHMGKMHEVNIYCTIWALKAVKVLEFPPETKNNWLKKKFF